MRKLILSNSFSPGDIVVFTAAVRDLHRCCPGQFTTDVRTPYPELWENNPWITPLKEGEPGVEVIEVGCPLIHRSNYEPWHYLHAYTADLGEALGLDLRPTAFSGDIHLRDDEKEWASQVAELAGEEIPFWLIVAGGKDDITIKWWEKERWQAVVDHFRGQIQFVQVGGTNHQHPALEGVIDLRGQTSLRQLVRLVYHAQGVLCPNTLAMHLAAAVPVKPGGPKNRPCVVVAGGREPVQWAAYPHHQFIHTQGALLCCDQGGCWKCRTRPLKDGSTRDEPASLCVDVVGKLPRCMDMITASEVNQRIQMYFNGGALQPLTTRQARLGVHAAKLSRQAGDKPDKLEWGIFRQAADRFVKGIPEYPGGHSGRGIIICGGGERYFGCAWVCINMLREHGCQLPIQLWHLGKEEVDEGMAEFLKPLGVECVDALERRQQHPVRRLGGWELKPYALLHSPFEEVMLLDADNVPLVNPEFLFDTPEFRKTGAIFWPDYGRLSPDRPIWEICGVKYRDEPEFESGQIVVDKRRNWKALTLAMWYNEHSDFFYRYIHGDKDTFHMAWRKLRRPYAMPTKGIHALPGTMCQHDFTGRRIFQHRNGHKWQVFGNNPRIAGFLLEDACLRHIQEIRMKMSSISRWLMAPGKARGAKSRLKLSYCTTCKGRLHQLQETLPVNLVANRAYDVEFIVLNYNSPDTLDEWMRTEMKREVESGRLIYARTTEPEFFHHAHAKNLAHRLATGDIVCNLDADNFATAEFTEHLLDLFSEHENTVTRGTVTGYGGRVALPRFWFNRLGGYDEALVASWGYEDNDLYSRGKDMGLKTCDLPERFAKVLSHPDSERMVHMRDKALNKSDSDAANRKLSHENREAGRTVANEQTGWAKGSLLVSFAGVREVSAKLPPTTHVDIPRFNSQNLRPCLLTVASQPVRGFSKFVESARRHGMEPVVLGSGQPYGGNTAKVRQVKDFLKAEGACYSHIIFCDAYDVVFAGGFGDILSRFATFASPIIFSAEWYCWPDVSLEKVYPPSPTRYRFLNSGVWVGETVAVWEMFHRLDTRLLQDRMCDQGLFTQLFLSGAAPIQLDYNCLIAQSLNGAVQDMQWDGKVIRNKTTGEAPLIFHGNGGADMSQVLKWLKLTKDTKTTPAKTVAAAQ